MMMMLKKVKGVRHKQFCRALPSEALTRTGKKLPGDGIKLDLSETGEVFSLGEILPEQAVGVLVDAALPRTVRVGQVDLDAGHLGEPFVLSHFTRWAGHSCQKFSKYCLWLQDNGLVGVSVGL